MKLKTIEIEGKTYAEVSDGKPLFLDGDKEIAFDAPGTVSTISRLNGEAKGHRERAEKAEASLKAFEGLTDPDAARKALETVKNLADKQLVDAGEVQKIKDEVTKAFQVQLADKDTAYKNLEGMLYGEKIGGAFARSKTIADKLAIPADLVEARFGKHFKIEDGKVIAYDSSGNKLYSKAKPGEPADFEEALDLLVDAYPYKDTILKGQTGAGGGAGQGGGGSGSKTMRQSDFDALPAKDRAAKMAEGYTLTA
jgi:hypothetical protein